VPTVETFSNHNCNQSSVMASPMKSREGVEARPARDTRGPSNKAEWHLINASRKDSGAQGVSPLTTSTESRARISPDSHTSELPFPLRLGIVSEQRLGGGRTIPEGVVVAGTGTKLG
jgi:hypothetical protein